MIFGKYTNIIQKGYKMKKLLLLAIASVFAFGGDYTAENTRLCKAYINKAHTYTESMRSDELAEATLDVYRDKVVAHCGAVSAKQPMDPCAAKFVLKGVEDKIKNVEMCKTAIDVAQTYEDIANKDEATINSYKKDVVANCGIISAKV